MGSFLARPLERAMSLGNVGVSFFWSLASKLARARSQASSKKRVRLPVRVISVGNLQVGGAGKTPLVAFLVKQAVKRGKTVCILTRGYGGPWESRGGVIAPGDSVSASQCGDEAALLHDLVPEAWIGVGAERARVFAEVQNRARQAGAIAIDLVVLDDGFQHHRLAKDLEIVALTSARWGDKLFRDFSSALAYADLVTWTKGDRRPADGGKPLVRAEMRPPQTDSGRSYLLVTGLADGKQAEESARAAGYRVEKHLRFRDHARYAEAVTQTIIQQAHARNLNILMTGKDWVKWREWVPSARRTGLVEVIEPVVSLDSESEKIWNRVVWGE